MASIITFLVQLHSLYGIHRPRQTTNKIICDNQGLLTRVEQATTWKYMTPNVTLRAERDLESVILDGYTKLGIPFTFLHVKSHQDEDGPVSDLTLEAQLNVQADSLATEALKDAPTYRAVALFPTAICQLIVGGASVTRKIPQAIRFQAGFQNIRTYLLERNRWSPATFEEIDWTSHGAAHSHHRDQRCYLLKLYHRHLPLGQTIHRRDKKYPARCPGCIHPTETHDHYIGCSAPSRIRWRIQLLAAIKQQTQLTNTADELEATLIDTIDRALAGRPISVSGKFATLLRSQEKIGWRAMLHGYWSVHWQQAYIDTYTPPNTESRKDYHKRLLSMARWQKRMLCTTFHHMIRLWKLRNEERHGIDTDTRESARREVLTNEIHELYIHRDQYPIRVQKLLRDSFAAHCTERVANLQDWIDAYRVTFAVTRTTP